MSIATTDTRVIAAAATVADPPSQSTGRRRAQRRMRRARIAILGGVLALAIGVGAAGTAQAATAPALYSGASNACVRIVDGSSVTASIDNNRPYAAVNYVGTTSLFWYEQVQYLTTSGTWASLGNFDNASATTYGRSGTYLTPIYWNGSQVNSGVSVNVVNGYDYRVVGITAWLKNGTAFTASSAVVVACDYRR